MIQNEGTNDSPLMVPCQQQGIIIKERNNTSTKLHSSVSEHNHSGNQGMFLLPYIPLLPFSLSLSLSIAPSKAKQVREQSRYVCLTFLKPVRETCLPAQEIKSYLSLYYAE